jgi:hypothetical protein
MDRFSTSETSPSLAEDDKKSEIMRDEFSISSTSSDPI